MSLVPDLILNTYDELTVEFLQKNNISALILDVDNTLIPYEENKPRPAVVAWLNDLTAAGIKVAFVTNNHKSRLDSFNETLGFPAFHDSCKPFLKNMRKAMQAMGASVETTANIGDQIFTDTWAGRRLGVRTFLVPPIKDKRDVFTRFKRLLEKPFKKAYYKRLSKGKENGQL